MKRIKTWIEQNPFKLFFLLTLFVILFLTKLFFYSIEYFKDPNTKNKIYSGSFQDIGDLFGATIGNAVGLAGSIVAIVLAVVALRLSQKQDRRELYDSIKQDISDTFSISYQVILGYTKIRYESYQSLEKIIEILKSTDQAQSSLNQLYGLANTTSEQGVIKIIKEEIEKKKEELVNFDKQVSEIKLKMDNLFDCFADDIHAIRENYFAFNAYTNNFKSHGEFQYCKLAGYADHFKTEKENFYADPLKITEMHLQMQEHSDFFNNALALLSSNVDSNTKKVLLPENINMVDYISLLSIGYCSGALQGKDKREYLINTMVILDILYNIPDQDDIKATILNERERQFNDQDIEFLNTMLNSPVCHQIKEFKEEINKLRSFVHNNFEKLFVQRV